MSKVLFLLFATLNFIYAQSNQYASGYDSEYSHYYPYNDNTGPASNEDDDISPACAGAISNANRAFTQLIKDIRTQAPQWNVFTDFDAINDVSYYITSQCKPENLDLVNQGETGLNSAEDQACEELFTLVLGVLEQNNATSFRGGFEEGIVIAKQGLEIGPRLGDNCQLELVPIEPISVEDGGELGEELVEIDPDNNNNGGDIKNKEINDSNPETDHPVQMFLQNLLAANFLENKH